MTPFQLDERHPAAWAPINILGRVRLGDGLIVISVDFDPVRPHFSMSISPRSNVSCFRHSAILISCGDMVRHLMICLDGPSLTRTCLQRYPLGISLEGLNARPVASSPRLGTEFLVYPGTTVYHDYTRD